MAFGHTMKSYVTLIAQQKEILLHGSLCLFIYKFKIFTNCTEWRVGRAGIKLKSCCCVGH